jgi:predicted SAM-dependent methyltransferase
LKRYNESFEPQQRARSLLLAARSFNEKLFWGRPIWDLTKIQLLISFIIRNKRMQLESKRLKSKYYLNVGCGENAHADFINIDFQWRPNIDLCWDIRKGMPFENNSMKGIFTEHCMEHLTFHQCTSLIGEFHRILCPGGIVRIIVPDAELYIDLYQKEKRGERVDFPFVTEQDLVDGFTPMMAVNRVFREHGHHHYAYDARTLNMMLKRAGFEDIRIEEFMKGRDKRLLIDNTSRAIESLYIEAELNG